LVIITSFIVYNLVTQNNIDIVVVGYIIF